MKYKLININTKEETLCDKVTIDGFGYYVSSDTNYQEFEGWFYYPFINELQINCNLDGCHKVIVTNNPNIDIPKVVDEVEALSNIEYPFAFGGIGNIENISKNHFIKGYNKSQESHPFSEKDMIEFADWLIDIKSSIAYEDETCHRLYKKLTKELLQIWKEQRPKIVYYESD